MKNVRFLLMVGGLLLSAVSFAQTKQESIAPGSYKTKPANLDRMSEARKTTYNRRPVREVYHPERRTRAVENQRCIKK